MLSQTIVICVKINTVLMQSTGTAQWLKCIMLVTQSLLFEYGRMHIFVRFICLHIGLSGERKNIRKLEWVLMSMVMVIDIIS